MEVARDGDSRYLLACSECDVRLLACLPAWALFLFFQRRRKKGADGEDRGGGGEGAAGVRCC